MIKRFHPQEGKLAESDREDSLVLVFVNPGDDEIKTLVNTYNVDAHTLTSALDPDELARLEFEPEHAALILKRPKNYSTEDNFLFKTISMGIFLFKEKLIIVISESMPIFDGKQFARLQSVEDVLLRIIYSCISHFLGHLKVINMMSESLEQKINTSMENKYLLNMFTLEKSLVYYLNAINSNSAVIEKLKTNASKIGFTAENMELLDDITVENSQCYKQAEIYSNILASLMDARASIVNNNLNILMKILNLIVVSIMVPTFVVSAFSMNVRIPLSQHPFAFWIVMGLASLSVLVFTVLWRYRKW